MSRTSWRRTATELIAPLLVMGAVGVGLLAAGCQSIGGLKGPAATPGKTGSELWAENCGRCHNFREPASYSDDQWAVAVHHMRLRVPLTGKQQREILKFLQASN